MFFARMSSSSFCWLEKRRLNSATVGSSTFRTGVVPVRVRELRKEDRATLLFLPKGPLSSGGCLGFFDELSPVSVFLATGFSQDVNGITPHIDIPMGEDCCSHHARALLVAQSVSPWRSSGFSKP